MKRALPFLALAALAGCGGNTTDPAPGLFTNSARDLRQREEAINRATKDLTAGTAAKAVAASNEFGTRLLGEIGDQGNVMISPLSISTALAMTMNGAVGQTRDDMLKTLGVGKLTVDQVNEAANSMREVLGAADPAKATLRVANSLWVKKDYKLETQFLAENSKAYNANIEDVDFMTADGFKRINDWVKAATEGKIEKIIGEDPDPLLRVVLVNAVYFKSGWKDKFDPEATKSGDFTVDKEKTVSVDFMNRNGKMGYAKKDWGSLVRLPYGDDRFEMVLALPEAGGDPVIAAKKLIAEKDLGLSTSQLVLSLPKWKSSYEKKLNEPLSKLGMGIAFTDKADFSAMKKGEQLAISSVIHKSFIEVNEEGTEAAAATGISVGTTSAPLEPTVVKFDRPFAYMIRESKTGQVLFLGVMRNPASAK